MITAGVWIIVLLLFVVGLIGTLVPALPGVGLIWLGIAIYAWASGFDPITLPMLGILAVMALLASGASYAGAALGSRLGGGKKLSIGGAVIGAIIGLMVANIVGLFVVAFLGAMIGALFEGKSGQAAAKTAALTVVGIIGGVVLQFTLGIIMISGFFIEILLGP